MNVTGADAKGADLAVAICCSGALLPGLHATLGSLVRNLRERDKIALHLYVSDIDGASRNELARTVNEAGGVGSLMLHDPDLSDFAGLGGLHGDRMTYLRLKLPDLLPDAEKILYLDADLVVQTDVGAMFELPLGDAPIGAIPGERVEWSLDHDIFREVGLDNYDTCFNAGVLLLNGRWWRANNCLARVLEFAQANPGLLRSHDQTLLNIFFSRSFYWLPEKYNFIVSPEAEPIRALDAIFHFMGSPKPWDLFGSSIHSNWKMWKDAVKPTRFRWAAFYLRYWRPYLRRAWSLRFSYVRVIRRKIDPPKWT